jgi:hypothetical protein
VDIHPPHGAIGSWRDFGLQLVTITAGILIALSLEGIRESFHNRALVREARENIHREIADNKREVDGEIAQMPARRRKIEDVLRFTHQMLDTKRSDIHTLELGLDFPTLSTASWQTAERTGALAHMDYAEVQKYAAMYAFQDFLAAQHRRALDAMSAAIGTIADGENGDPTKAPPAEIERLRQQIVALKSILFVEEQMAQTASERYQKALE